VTGGVLLNCRMVVEKVDVVVPSLSLHDADQNASRLSAPHICPLMARAFDITIVMHSLLDTAKPLVAGMALKFTRHQTIQSKISLSSTTYKDDSWFFMHTKTSFHQMGFPQSNHVVSTTRQLFFHGTNSK
jgi:hypothetical protein